MPQIDHFMVYRKTKSGKKLYLSFSEYNLFTGVIKPYFTSKRNGWLLNSWDSYYMSISCKEFLEKWKGKLIKEEKPFVFQMNK